MYYVWKSYYSKFSIQNLEITKAFNYSTCESMQSMDNVISSGPAATLWELVNMDITLQPDIWEEACMYQFFLEIDYFKGWPLKD